MNRSAEGQDSRKAWRQCGHLPTLFRTLTPDEGTGSCRRRSSGPIPRPCAAAHRGEPSSTDQPSSPRPSTEGRTKFTSQQGDEAGTSARWPPEFFSSTELSRRRLSPGTPRGGRTAFHFEDGICSGDEQHFEGRGLRSKRGGRRGNRAPWTARALRDLRLHDGKATRPRVTVAEAAGADISANASAQHWMPDGAAMPRASPKACGGHAQKGRGAQAAAPTVLKGRAAPISARGHRGRRRTPNASARTDRARTEQLGPRGKKVQPEPRRCSRARGPAEPGPTDA